MELTWPSWKAPLISRWWTTEDTRCAYGEQRMKSLAQWRGRVVVLIWTPRANHAHLISCRHADKHQTRRYLAVL